MKKKLEWKVFTFDFNRDELEIFNVFDHGSFMEDLNKNFKKNKNDFDAFAKQLDVDLHYYFWSKAEWELIMSPLISRKATETKIDVYDQISLNKDAFINYTWKTLKGDK